MKPNRIILIRHGESEGNVNKRIYAKKADYKLDLTEKGRKEAQNAGYQLQQLLREESVFFYVSPLYRTRETFEQIAVGFKHDQFKYREEPRLREQEWGHLKSEDECDRIDRERDEYGTFYYRIPDGESAADVYDRVSDFFGSLFRDFEKPGFPDNAVIITHGMTIRLFLMRWFHWTVEHFEELKNPVNCEMVVLERNSIGKYELVSNLRRKQSDKTKQRPIKLLPHQ